MWYWYLLAYILGIITCWYGTSLVQYTQGYKDFYKAEMRKEAAKLFPGEEEELH